MIMAAAAIAVFLLDRLTKFLVVNSFFLGDSRPIIPGVLHLTYILNPGAAFGIFSGSRLALSIVTVIVISLLIYLAREFRYAGPWLAVALGLQLGGAISNLFDRILLGEVIDFIDLRVWPVFNLADSAIVVGVALFAYLFLFRIKEPEVDSQ